MLTVGRACTCHRVGELGKTLKATVQKGFPTLMKDRVLCFIVWSILSATFKSEASHLKGTIVFVLLVWPGAELPGDAAGDSVF